MLPYIVETHLVDHCNLNCKGCSHFAPLVHDEGFTNIDIFKRDITKLRQIFNDVYEIRLMGGEPLLHPEIDAFTKVTREIFPKARIAIATNGVLLQKMQSSFWETCEEKKALIKITNYPIHLDFKAIRQLAESHKVQIKIPKQVNAFFQFMNLNGNANPTWSFQTCRAMYLTPFLRDGKLYSCSFAPHAFIFNNYFKKVIPISEDDSINILEDVTAKEVLDFLAHPIPLCKWCLEKRPTMEWGRTKKEMNEWVGGKKSELSHFFDTNKYKAISIYHLVRQSAEMRKRVRNDN